MAFEKLELMLPPRDFDFVDGACACGAPGMGVRYRPGSGLEDIPPICAGCFRRDVARIAAPPAPSAPAASGLQPPPLYATARLAGMDGHGAPENHARIARLRQLGAEYVARWSERAGGSFPVLVVLRGGPGTGKGHWLWSVILELGAVRARYVTLADLIADLRARWSDSEGPSETARLASYRWPDLLVIDEVSRDKVHGSPAKELFDVVDWRQQQYKPTLLVSNELQDAPLAELLGPAVTSRVMQWSGVYDFGTVDYRATVLARRRKV